jgi:uncharacterized protein YggE
MALAAGERLGPVCSLTDNSQTNAYYPEGQMSTAAGSDALPLEAGSQQESDQVTVVYDLLPPRIRR